MEKYMIIGIIILLIVMFVAWLIVLYNKLVGLRNQVDNQWSQIEVQLKKRYDLIPNLVESVKGYVKHENDTINEVLEARTSLINAKTSSAEMAANNQLEGALGKLFALSEAYPELKADTNFKNLQESLKDVEDKIAYARQFYNDVVLKYNNAIEVFPTFMVAGILGFKHKEFLKVEENEKNNVKIKF